MVGETSALVPGRVSSKSRAVSKQVDGDVNVKLEAELAEQKKRLNNAKVDRKRADSDAQMLANRLLLLKAEMSKAQRKIEETKSRTSFIKKIKKDADLRMKQRQMDEAKKQQAMSSEKVIIEKKRHKINQRSKSAVSKSQLLQEKREIAKKIKEDQMNNMMMMQHQREMEWQKAVKARRQIQQQHANVQKKKTEERKKKLKAVREQLKERIELEEEQAALRQAEIDRMEKEELELIEQLQKTQLQQKNAYDELESALSNSQNLLVEAGIARAHSSSSKASR